MDKTIQKRNRWLLTGYILIALLCLLPTVGIFNSSSLVVAVPLTVLWLTLCFIGLAVLTTIGYAWVFKPWAMQVDESSLKAKEKETQ